MLFNSYFFILLFLPLAIMGYFGLNKIGKYKAAIYFILLMNLFFVGFGSIWDLFVLSFTLLVNYGLACLMKRVGKGKCKKTLVMGIIFNLVILFIFKYYNFFVENINRGMGIDIPLLYLALPLGISFYTFAEIAYLTDCYKECIEGNGIYNYSITEYATYISFFPKFIQGPIAYHHEIIMTFRDLSAKKVDYVNLCKGIYAFTLGFSKKVLIADTLAKIVNIGYNNIEALSTIDVILVMVSYSLQIYFDFSGYCDMAYGIGYMLNIKLPINFNSPYKSVSITDFWSRWHMTLTRFFTRYVYIPLGGNRRGNGRTLVNIMIVFLLSGIWHGANWTFVLWGALNGIWMIFERVANVKKWKIPQAIGRGMTFIFATFAWSIFRAESIGQVGRLWKGLFAGGHKIYAPFVDSFNSLIEISILRRIGLESFMLSYPYFLLLLFIIVLLFACFFMENTQNKVETMNFTTRKAIVVVTLMVWSIMSLSEISEFIYTNF